MSQQKTPHLVVVGQIAGGFGVKGEARVRSFTEDPEACFGFGPLMDAAGVILLTPAGHRPLADGFAVKVKENHQREHWEAMKGALLHTLRSSLPKLEEDEVYVSDLVGLSVQHVDGRDLGKIKTAHDFGAGDLIEIQPPHGPSFLIPFTRESVPEVNLRGGLVRIDPDEALLPESLQRQDSDGGTN